MVFQILENQSIVLFEDIKTKYNFETLVYPPPFKLIYK